MMPHSCPCSLSEFMYMRISLCARSAKNEAEESQELACTVYVVVFNADVLVTSEMNMLHLMELRERNLRTVAPEQPWIKDFKHAVPAIQIHTREHQVPQEKFLHRCFRATLRGQHRHQWSIFPTWWGQRPAVRPEPDQPKPPPVTHAKSFFFLQATLKCLDLKEMEPQSAVFMDRRQPHCPIHGAAIFCGGSADLGKRDPAINSHKSTRPQAQLGHQTDHFFSTLISGTEADARFRQSD
ncbi:hypothetical protein NDU88_004021 [Pleurodeles waltl]|uniref:Uncharacterized protein n=1 Tax=Pleurodeles waltl TaxID=8319 RepID=A0AAV7TSA5_PLEWA|nr:hypothetical protein NDU88_004021 [Pleurodeles waltl]